MSLIEFEFKFGGDDKISTQIERIFDANSGLDKGRLSKADLDIFDEDSACIDKLLSRGIINFKEVDQLRYRLTSAVMNEIIEKINASKRVSVPK